MGCFWCGRELPDRHERTKDYLVSRPLMLLLGMSKQDRNAFGWVGTNKLKKVKARARMGILLDRWGGQGDCEVGGGAEGGVHEGDRGGAGRSLLKDIAPHLIYGHPDGIDGVIQEMNSFALVFIGHGHFAIEGTGVHFSITFKFISISRNSSITISCHSGSCVFANEYSDGLVEIMSDEASDGTEAEGLA